MYGLRNSELSTCLFQFSHKTCQTMLLYAYFTPKVDFKCKFNHHQSFLYEWRLTAWTIRKFRIGPSIRIESWIGRTIWNRIESRRFAGPYSRLLQRVSHTDGSVGLILTLTLWWQEGKFWQSAEAVEIGHEKLPGTLGLDHKHCGTSWLTGCV